MLILRVGTITSEKAIKRPMETEMLSAEMMGGGQLQDLSELKVKRWFYVLIKPKLCPIYLAMANHHSATEIYYPHYKVWWWQHHAILLCSRPCIALDGRG